MKFDKYYIEQKYSEITDELTEISPEMYRILMSYFSDEKIFNGEDVTFLETTWSTVIAVTQGKVYKISLQTSYNQLTSEGSQKDLYDYVLDGLNDELSEYSDQKRYADSFVTTWDTNWGNLILNKTTLPDKNAIFESWSVILDITATGKFAFRKLNRRDRILHWFRKI
jgi:hypothetical protein